MTSIETNLHNAAYSLRDALKSADEEQASLIQQALSTIEQVIALNEDESGTCPQCGRLVGLSVNGSLNIHGNLNTGVCPGSHETVEVMA